MNKFKVVLIAILIFSTSFIVILFVLNKRAKKSLVQQTSNNQPIKSTNYNKEILINNVPIFVEIADTNEKRQQGLSNRISMQENQGMLFDFGQKDIIPGFWMKDMLIPLDFIWINDGIITQIDKNIQAPKDNSNLQIYKPSKPIDYVLEVNAGFADKNNIKVGDSVDLDPTFEVAPDEQNNLPTEYPVSM